MSRSRCGPRSTAGTRDDHAVVVADRAASLPLALTGSADTLADDPAAAHDHSPPCCCRNSVTPTELTTHAPSKFAAAATALARGAARLHRLRACFVVPAFQSRPTAAPVANRTGISPRCRCCRRHCRIARVPWQDRSRPRARRREGQFRSNIASGLASALFQQSICIQRPEPSAQAAPRMRQALPVLGDLRRGRCYWRNEIEGAVDRRRRHPGLLRSAGLPLHRKADMVEGLEDVEPGRKCGGSAIDRPAHPQCISEYNGAD